MKLMFDAVNDYYAFAESPTCHMGADEVQAQNDIMYVIRNKAGYLYRHSAYVRTEFDCAAGTQFCTINRAYFMGAQF
jgi:hypothetical protein